MSRTKKKRNPSAKAFKNLSSLYKREAGRDLGECLFKKLN
jgi:hypothetical protein